MWDIINTMLTHFEWTISNNENVFKYLQTMSGLSFFQLNHSQHVPSNRAHMSRERQHVQLRHSRYVVL